MSTNIEIERKFLIVMPNIEALIKGYTSSKSQIEQYYLKSVPNVERRIRKETINDDLTLFKYTEKVDNPNSTGITRQELETDISEQGFNSLLGQSIDGENLEKIRYKVNYNGKIFELDIYPFCSDKAIMEIELEYESEKFEIPPEIQVIQEVTGQKKYKNSTIAKTKQL